MEDEKEDCIIQLEIFAFAKPGDGYFTCVVTEQGLDWVSNNRLA
jgi:hypothetical protein